MSLIKVDGIEKKFKRIKVNGNEICVLQQICFSVNKGEVLGILGESGSGKTTLARCLMGAIGFRGTVYYQGEAIDYNKKKNGQKWFEEVQMVYQDSFSAFDPKKTFRYSMEEALAVRKQISRDEYSERIQKVLQMVHLEPKLLERLPGNVSGGECQRMNIARALLAEPQVLILDEPVSALDITVQKQILSILKEIQAAKNLTYLFISHDLPVVNYLCDKVLVLYKGEIVEYGDVSTVLHNPQHWYTKRLLENIPLQKPKNRKNDEK